MSDKSKIEPGFDWNAELSETDRDALIETLSQKVAQRGLFVPAILFLEMHKPVTFFAGQGLVLASGFLAPVFGPQNLQKFAKLLESRENVERLIRAIESKQEPTRSQEATPSNTPT